MSIFKKLLIFIMIPVMIMVLIVGISKNNVYANSKFSKRAPVKIAVFFDNSNAMYISSLKQNLELIQKENSKREFK